MDKSDEWVRRWVFDGPIGKQPFLRGSRAFALRASFPDFDFQAHDFWVDEVGG